MKRILLIISAVSLCLSAAAVVPHRMNIPDIPGYTTLKGDFHVHTVMSDDKSWPTSRIDEAFYDGLDVISMTDHTDTRHLKMVKKGYFNPELCTRNTSYQLASEHAKKYGIIVLHGGEITRGLRLFPGHFNAHFLQDGNQLASQMEKQDNEIKDDVTREETAIFNALEEARKQGAFLVWNHPNWEPQEPNDVTWHPIHERVYKAGLMDGIEIENHSIGFSPEAFHMAMERNLTIVSGTDCHQPMNQLVDYERGEFRSMTLLFVKERSEKGVREALDNHRTAVYADGCVYGKEEFIKPLLESCIKISDVKITDGKVSFTIENVSSIPVKIHKAPGSETLVMERAITINAGEIYPMEIVPVYGKKHFELKNFEINYYIENFQTDANTPLLVSYKIAVPKK